VNSLPSYSSAAERNSQPILDQLKDLLPVQGTILEIGSGTGQHAVFFTRSLPGLRWQPTDREANLAGLQCRFEQEANERILPPLRLDVLADPYTAHIMSWDAVVAMFEGVAARLIADARFCLYGPFNVNQQFTAPSNAQFDAQLRAGDPDMGIRDMQILQDLAMSQQMALEYRLEMPANNFLLVFRKTSGLS
jgi:hypothetical protein